MQKVLPCFFYADFTVFVEWKSISVLTQHFQCWLDLSLTSILPPLHLSPFIYLPMFLPTLYLETCTFWMLSVFRTSFDSWADHHNMRPVDLKKMVILTFFWKSMDRKGPNEQSWSLTRRNWFVTYSNKLTGPALSLESFQVEADL